MSEEQTIWRGTSIWANYLGYYVVCVLWALLVIPMAILCRGSSFFGTGLFFLLVGIWLLIPAVAAAIKWMGNTFRIYEATNQRIKVTCGIISKRTDELELYRVRDIALVEPITLRLFGAGNIVLTTNDATTPTVVLEGIPGVKKLQESLRSNIEICRDQKKVRLAELD
jgi:uncharacterized membrane protein YdbT with pleckstrin-like domain